MVFFTGFTPGTGLEGGISSSSTTEFFADGTFSGESFGGAFGNFDGGGGFSTRHDGATGGTYTVNGGMVISTPTNGRAATAALGLQLDDGKYPDRRSVLERGPVMIRRLLLS